MSCAALTIFGALSNHFSRQTPQTEHVLLCIAAVFRRAFRRPRLRVRPRESRYRPPPDQARASLDQRPARAHEPNHKERAVGSSRVLTTHPLIQQRNCKITIKELIHRWMSLSPMFPSLFRIVLGLIMLQYGMMKLFAFPASMTHGKPLTGLIFASAYIEFLGGLFLTFGLVTRFVAFVMSGEMAFAYFLWHAPKSHWPVLNGGNLPVVLCFSLFFLSSAGGGPLSVDSWRRRKTR